MSWSVERLGAVSRLVASMGLDCLVLIGGVDGKHGEMARLTLSYLLLKGASGHSLTTSTTGDDATEDLVKRFSRKRTFDREWDGIWDLGFRIGN